MAKREEIELRFEEMLGKVLEKINEGCVENPGQAQISIYDVEYVKEGADWYLRGYIDKEGGVTIDDCEAVSRGVSDALDADDFVEEAYILEISSPGLGRTLKKDRHFEQSLGQDVEGKLFKAKDGTKNGSKNFEGRLVSFDANTVTIATDSKTEETYERSAIAKICLKVEL